MNIWETYGICVFFNLMASLNGVERAAAMFVWRCQWAPDFFLCYIFVLFLPHCLRVRDFGLFVK
jgi:hypothetical protein